MKKYEWIGTLEVETSIGPYRVTRYGNSFGSVLSQFNTCMEILQLERKGVLNDEVIHIRRNNV